MRAKKTLEGVGVYDTGARVYSSVNPPPGGGSVRDVQAADQAISVVASTTVTDLVMSVTASGHYHFTCCLIVTSAATTTGIQPSVLVSGTAATRIAYTTLTPATQTTSTTSNNAKGGATAALAAPVLVKIEGMAYWSATPAGGTSISIQVASEVAGSAVTVHAGSHLEMEKVA